MLAAPKNKTPWRIAGKSDVGVVRHTNEDAFFCDAGNGGYFAVADGVGGLDLGEEASRTAIAAVRRIFDAASIPVTECPNFVEIYREIDAEIDAKGEELGIPMGIATTLDIAVDGGHGLIYFSHIGDSGIFVLHGNELIRLSDEHTLAAEERAKGNENFPLAYINTLTRALGVSTCVIPQVFSFKTVPGDKILIATDGITRTISSEEMKRFLADPNGTPESIADALIRAANDAGGFDNSTAVIAFI